MFLPGESQGWGSLVVCCLWGRVESDTTEVLSRPSSSKDNSLGNRMSDISERLFQTDSGESTTYEILERVQFNLALTLQNVRSRCHHEGFCNFLDMKRCKDWDHEINFWKYLSKDQLHQFCWSTLCFIFHPEFPSGGVEGQQLHQHRFQSPQRQMENVLVVGQ